MAYEKMKCIENGRQNDSLDTLGTLCSNRQCDITEWLLPEATTAL
jgi:hypothetical protein